MISAYLSSAAGISFSGTPSSTTAWRSQCCGLKHIDINSNTFRGNGLAIDWRLCFNPATGLTQSKMVELNHNTMVGNAEAVRVEKTPGVFTNDYRDDPGCFVQWVDLTIDGVLQPPYKARTCSTVTP